ncbi:MAG: M20/M25/M40 family metallo-hydrolase [Streptomycetaceae bacterium]|jgi:acetylornithine deacetylase/succinyl-diaminopimelate desuccinylase-like protein|nr:MAG: M20/M25/M40 family metallo-hydrolase [Streptomycetaceae bacterium]
MDTSSLSRIEQEAISICQDLIRIPSVNFGDGKGDEAAVAAYVIASLAEVGIASTMYESAPGRCNVMARLEGTNSNRPGLVVHGHIDVVPANADDWSVDPFCGDIKDGMIWGRGAVDMKNMDAMMLATVREWARTGYKPPRDIVLAFFADEEAGSIYGSHWMVNNHPELFAGCNEAVSEVGGFSVTVANGKRLYMIETAEKGIHWMRLTATGRAGHGSVMNEENALTRLTDAVSAIGNYSWPQRYSTTVKALFKRVAEVTGKAYDEKDLRPLLSEVGFAARMIGATLQNTANPTMLQAGYKANVIPGSASAVIDGRFIPGFEDELNSTIQSLIGPHVSVETITRDKALEVPFEGDLVDAMCAAILKEDSEAIPVPYLMSGGTDNKALAELGIIGYGFSPLKLDAEFDFMAMFHGVDERVPVDGLTFGVRTLKDFLENC